jgi:hypothetical protein
MRSASDNPKLLDGVLLQNAVSFVAAADAYAAADKLRDWFPLYFMFGQSVELALKAFALNKGATERELMKIGHNLVKALDRAQLDGLDVSTLFSADERAAIALLGKWHLEQVTRYPLLQGYAIPRPQIIREVLDKLITAVYTEIWGLEMFEEDRASERGLGLSLDTSLYSA